MMNNIPTRIQGYQDMKLLCQTESSYIYVSQRDGTPLDEKIILKFIPLKDNGHKNKIDSECRIHSSIGHSYIMPINTFFDYNDGSQLYRVIEMPLGVDNLCNIFSKHLICGLRHITELFTELTAAVDYLHENKILHGAICPENIIMKKEKGEYLIPQLSGFQYARLLSIYTTDETKCNCRNFVPNFAAPELLERRSHSYSSDIWSFGCVIFNILTGDAPFEGKNPAELMENITALKFTPAVERLPRLAKDLIMKILILDPTKRLGYGEEKNQYPSIKNHPFFKGIEWGSLSKVEMPLFTKFEEEAPETIADNYLRSGEKVILQEDLLHKRKIRWQERVVFLTSMKRLLLFNPKKDNKFKHEIKFTTDSRVECNPNGKDWTLICGKIQNTFRCKGKTSGMWAATLMREMMKP